MMIGTFDGVSRPRLAQSAKSKAFHFRARLCGVCNSKLTQPADIEFAKFDELARERLEAGLDPGAIFDETRYAIGGEPYLNLFRYLAKVLACQIAEVDGPRILAITEFAIGHTDFNPVRLGMGPDPSYPALRKIVDTTQFAAHGGLSVELSRRTGLVNCLRSTLTHGPLRYSFSIAFYQPIGLALQQLYPVFHERCVVAYGKAVADNNLSQSAADSEPERTL